MKLTVVFLLFCLGCQQVGSAVIRAVEWPEYAYHKAHPTTAPITPIVDPYQQAR